MYRKKTWIDQPIQILQTKFWEDFQDKKKIQALQNLATARSYRQKNLVNIVAEDYKYGFLEPQERAFLDFCLEKYSLDYLNWCHRTKMLKMQISDMKLKYIDKSVKQAPVANVAASKPVQLPLFPEIEKMPVAKTASTKSTFKRWVASYRAVI